VTATLRELLVFEVKAGCAGFTILPDSFRTHLAFTETGVGVSNKGEATRMIDIFYKLGEGF
jgi:hypothetical protein